MTGELGDGGGDVVPLVRHELGHMGRVDVLVSSSFTLPGLHDGKTGASQFLEQATSQTSRLSLRKIINRHLYPASLQCIISY